MDFSLHNTQKDLALRGKKQAVKAIVDAFFALEKKSFKTLSIVFITDSHMKKLHEEFFQDPTSTDVITFPLSKDEGELYICPKTALTYAKKHGIKPYEELTLYIVHGLLHLLGHDDIDPALRKKMRKSEKKHMSNLKKKGLCI